MPDTIAICVQPQVTVGVVVTPPATTPLTIGLQGPMGPQGPQGDPGSIGTVIINEVPSGLLDGSNRVFTVARPAAQLSISLNGVMQTPGASNDFTFAGNSITFTAANTPRPGDVILATYTY